MNSKLLRSRLIPATIAVAALATISVPSAAASAALTSASASAAQAQQSVGLTVPSLRVSQPGPRMI